jgi:hypothetical protein
VKRKASRPKKAKAKAKAKTLTSRPAGARVRVRFIVADAPWSKGDVLDCTPETAAKLVRNGVAVEEDPCPS